MQREENEEEKNNGVVELEEDLALDEIII